MAAFKTEDGEKFPAAAYAYVPDTEKSSTWKIRLWESPAKKITRRQLGAAAAAFSPGGFMGNRVQIPAGDVAKVKGRVRAAYKSLGISDKKIPTSVKESDQMRRLIMREATALTEAGYDADLGEVDVTIIRPGFNASKSRFYPREMLARDYQVFEGVKMYADHQTAAQERAQPERSVGQGAWVGSLKKVYVAEDGSIKARVAIIEDWFKSKLSNLRDHELLHEMGTSIVATGEGHKTEVEGCRTDFIEKLIRGKSVDFVTYPGAGGAVECYESARPEDETDVEIVTLEVLREQRPDLIEIIEGAHADQTSAQEKGNMDELEKQVKDLTEANTDLAATNDELKTKVTAQEATAAKAETEKLISEAELPDATKARLTDQFKEAATADGVAEAVEAATVEIAALRETGTIKGLGDTTPVPEEKDETAATKLYESRKAQYLAQGNDEATAERMAVVFVKG